MMKQTLGMRQYIPLFFISVVFFANLSFSYAQTLPRIPFNTPVEGRITTPNDEAVWSFTGGLNMAISIRVVPEGNFDPILILRDTSGNELIRNDDYAYPERRDALLEAITLPRAGEYQVVVRGYETSTGDFIVTMLAGYADFALDERFTSVGAWQGDNLAFLDVVDGILTMRVQGISQIGRLTNSEIPPHQDFYAQMTVSNMQGRNGWIIGLAFREQENGNRYVFSVNARGEWRLTLWENNQQRTLRDWMTHPAIQAGQTSFTLGILAKGVSLDVFYNTQMLASLSDATIQHPGRIGIQADTANALDSQTTAIIDGLEMTIPTTYNGEFIFPQQIMAGNSALVSHELERRHLIPTGGQLAWQVAESFLEASRPGVDRLPLITDTRFTNFVMSTTVSATVTGDGTGACALLFQHEDERNYTVAYLDNNGGFGVSRRQGDTFREGVFGEDASWRVTTQSQLLVIVNSGALYYYVNSRFVGKIQINPIFGQVGNAVVNFDPVRTNCQFRNTWVWRLN